MAQTAGVYIERNTQGVPLINGAEKDIKAGKRKKIQEKEAFIHTAKINASKIFSKYL
ncbi:MAG: hypothetical protein LBT48_04015 [Prevotellaceae bacterium]|jgi:hypothetical protein|nr:hypothetical protein [Prevotellaceae bacterium]